MRLVKSVVRSGELMLFLERCFGNYFLLTGYFDYFNYKREITRVLGFSFEK